MLQLYHSGKSIQEQSIEMKQLKVICNMKNGREILVKDYIPEALLQLMKKKPYHTITITELCEKAGVARVSFYRNYKSKDAVLVKLIEAITENFRSSTQIIYQNDPPEAFFVMLMTHMKNQRDLCDLLYQAQMLYLVSDEFDRVFQSVYAGKYDPYKSSFISGGIYSVFYHWLRSGWRETPREIADKLAEVLEK